MNLTSRLSLKAILIVVVAVSGMTASDYYSILEVSRMSDAQQIKKAYKTKLIKLHPDRFPPDKKKEMEDKFKKVQEAYEVLGDPHLKQAYDRMGMAGVEQAKKDKQQREQWENQNKMYQEQYQAQQKRQDPLANSPLELVNLENISKFHRRYQVWILLFYKPDDADIRTVAPLIEKLKTDYEGIFSVARINCLDEEELCREFLVYGTTKIMVFSSFSGFDGKDLDFSEELESAKRGEGLKLLAYVANEAISLMEDFVTFLSENSIKDFESRKGPKLVLFTAKNITPPMWKALSKDFKNSAGFGISRGQDNELAQRMKVEKFPSILGFKSGWLTSPSVYTGDFKMDAIKRFIRDMISGNDEQRDELQLLNASDLWQHRSCGAEDKKYCLFILTDEPENTGLQETLAILKKELAKEPFKIAVVSRDYFAPDLMSENGLSVQSPDLIIVRGSFNKVEAFSAPDYHLPTIREHVNNLLSSIVSLKKAKQPIERYVSFASSEL